MAVERAEYRFLGRDIQHPFLLAVLVPFQPIFHGQFLIGLDVGHILGHDRSERSHGVVTIDQAAVHIGALHLLAVYIDFSAFDFHAGHLAENLHRVLPFRQRNGCGIVDDRIFAVGHRRHDGADMRLLDLFRPAEQFHVQEALVILEVEDDVLVVKAFFHEFETGLSGPEPAQVEDAEDIGSERGAVAALIRHDLDLRYRILVQGTVPPHHTFEYTAPHAELFVLSLQRETEKRQHERSRQDTG